MAIKVIKDFQQGDTVIVRLEFAGAINLTGNLFNITMSKDGKGTAEYNVDYSADSNNHPDDNVPSGIINLPVDTTGLSAGSYMYSITRTDSDGFVTTIARSGLNSVDTVECKKKL